jgi:hypothetical protein
MRVRKCRKMKLSQQWEGTSSGKHIATIICKALAFVEWSPHISVTLRYQEGSRCLRNDMPFGISTELSGYCFMYVPAILLSLPMLWIPVRYKKKAQGNRNELRTIIYAHYCKIYVIQIHTKRTQVCAVTRRTGNGRSFYVILPVEPLKLFTYWS